MAVKEKSMLIKRTDGTYRVATPKPGRRDELKAAYAAKGVEVVRESVTVPSVKTMEKWSDDGVAKTPCGCRVEPDGTCAHGVPSWLILVGVI